MLLPLRRYEESIRRLNSRAGYGWLKPVIPPTQEAERGWRWFKARLGKKLAKPYLKEQGRLWWVKW
jgi:hypothetical protein